MQQLPAIALQLPAIVGSCRAIAGKVALKKAKMTAAVTIQPTGWTGTISQPRRGSRELLTAFSFLMKRMKRSRMRLSVLAEIRVMPKYVKSIVQGEAETLIGVETVRASLQL